MKKILYIGCSDPRTTKSGGAQRSNFIWRALKSLGEVYTVVSCFPGQEMKANDDKEKIRFVRIYQPGRLKRVIGGIAGKLKIGQLFDCPFGYASQAIGWQEVEFDFVVVRYAWWAAAWSAWNFAPMYIDVDDVPMVEFDSLLQQRLPRWMRPICRFFFKHWQAKVLSRAKGLWVPNKDDVRLIDCYAPTKHLRNLAKSAPDEYAVVGKQRKILLTVGFMGHTPNAEGVSWFVREVWPKVYAEHPDWIFAVAGGGAAETDKQAWAAVSGVRVLGFVDDLNAEYEKAAAVVAPILSGAGTCIKVMESCLRGRKTFVTHCACRGYENESSLQLQEFSDADDFVKELDAWIAQDDQVKEGTQRAIQAAAEKINSFEDFAAVIREALMI